MPELWHTISIFILQEIFCLEPEQTTEGKLEVISRRNLPASNFSALLAEQHLSEVQAPASGLVQQIDSGGLGNTAIAQVLLIVQIVSPANNNKIETNTDGYNRHNRYIIPR